MTDEVSIRASRARRRAGGDDDPPAPPQADDVAADSERAPEPGEAAWRLGGEPLSSPTGDTGAGRAASDAPAAQESMPFASFPGFPGMGEEEEATGPGADIARFVRGVWKRRWLVLGVAGLFTALSVAIAFTLINKKWEGVAVLVLRTHQDKFALGGNTPFTPQEYNLRTLIDTVKLPSSLDALMKGSGVNVRRRKMADAINVTPGKESNVFAVRVIWQDPRIAAKMANEVARILIERSRDLRRTDAEEVFDYYSAQLEGARADREALTAELRSYQQGTNASDFDTQTKVIIEELAGREADHRTRAAEVEALTAALGRLIEAIAEQPEMVVLSTIYRSPLKQRLTDYEWQLQEALGRYTPANPKVVKLQKRINVLKQLIAESKDEGAPQNTYAPNQQLADMRLRLQVLTDDLSVREAQVAALGAVTQGMRDELERLTSSRKGYELIRSRLDGAETLESNLITRVDEARVIMLRDEARIGLVEAARPPQEPAPSGRRLMVTAGVVLGAGAGLLLALLLELLDPVVRTRRDAMDLTGCDNVCEFQRVPPGEHLLVDANAPNSRLATVFRRIANELESRAHDHWESLALTSVEPGVGRTLTATNLAQLVAMKGQSVILVDADLRSGAGPRPGDLFEIAGDRRGLGDALREAVSLPGVVATDIRGLHFIGPGPLPDPSNAANDEDGQDDGQDADEPAGDEPAGDEALVALGSRQFASIAAHLQQTGRRILYDFPPLSEQETVLEAAAEIGNIALVVRSGQTRRDELKAMSERLEARDIKVRVVVVTDVPAELMTGVAVFEEVKRKRARKKPTRRRSSGMRPVAEANA